MLLPQPTPVQELDHPLFSSKEVKVAIKRLDLVHPVISGNKFYKLKYNLEKAIQHNLDTVLTFGGAFSNHIYATAAASKAVGIKSIGIIRGDRVDPLNPTLSFAENAGMHLHFVDRESYRKKNEPAFLEILEKQFGKFYCIPEGGTNKLAIQGTSEILCKEEQEYTHITTSIGTGGTFAGLLSSINSAQKLIGFSALKGEFIHQELADLLKMYAISPLGDFEIRTDYHFGGYAKWKPELIEFMQWFWGEFRIELDPVYTAKMLFGLFHLIKRDYFPKGASILAMHTGGLQGNKGFQEMTGIKVIDTDLANETSLEALLDLLKK